MAAVDDKVKQIIVEQLGVDEGEVTSNASFVDDLGADSLDTVELVWRLKRLSRLKFRTKTRRKSVRYRTRSITSVNTRKAESSWDVES